MEETLREELLAKTKKMLDAGEWDGVERLWKTWVELGEVEAEFQLAYHYLHWTPRDDDATVERMEALIRKAAAKDHPDAIWFLATHLGARREKDPEVERLLLRAGQLGSVNAYRALGVAYATGDWTGPKDLREAARWYRLAAGKGDAESQYDLGFMLLLGEGEPKNTNEGLGWLQRAGELGDYQAFRLLTDCYENGYCGVPVDPVNAALWRNRMEEWERLNPPGASLRYFIEGEAAKSSLDCLWDIEGVTGFGYMKGKNEFFIFYDPALIAPADLDERIRGAGILALRTTEHRG